MTKVSTDLDRFWVKVDTTGVCWEWRAATVFGKGDATGYGQFWAKGRLHRAHRWVYGQLVAPLIEGSHIDHLCRNTLCVRPGHLEQVTPRVNCLRGSAPAAVNAKKTHCIRGHEFTLTNTRVCRDGRRSCRACDKAYDEARPGRRRISA